jgi:hypothetical protein
MLSTVKSHLLESPYFQRYNGSDHFLIHSINQPMFHFLNRYCASLYELCHHCLKLSIDTYSSKMYPILAERLYLSHNWVSIPFPSSYHMSKGMKVIPWIEDPPYSPRPHLISFVGTSFVTARKQQKLRLLLMDECSRRPECFLYELPSHHMNTLQRPNDASSVSIYLKSTFCLMPGGDFPTRKGVLDSLLSGCIPVTFQKRSAISQWLWHWGSPQIAQTCVVYLPRDAVVENVSSLFDELYKLSQKSKIMGEKRQCISAIGHRLQYNHPLHEPYHDGQMKHIDAVDVVMQHIFHYHNT